MGFKFQGFDLLHLDSSFSEDELLVRKTARDFVEDNLVPIIEECFGTERFPRELVPIMGELGFFGANLEGYGCAGMSNVEYGLVMQELERGDSGFRSFVSVQSGLVMYPIYTFGSDEQKNTWLPALASGEKLGCFGLTEPGAGSNPGAMTTTARKVGDEYVLNGEKLWITSGTIADVAIVFAKVEDEGGKVHGFLIETNRPGFSAYDVHGKWSLRASHTSGLALHVGRLKDAGTVGHEHISLIKRNNVWMALECARISRDILGANGITDDYPIMRHMMNLESVITYEGTHDIHTLILGQHLTGIPAY
jgi:glutaryl-CoA dehydrogenase